MNWESLIDLVTGTAYVLAGAIVIGGVCWMLCQVFIRGNGND